MIRKINYYGNPFIGLFFYTDDRYTLVPRNIQDKFMEDIKCLNTDIVKASISECELLGIFIEGNKNGIILPYQSTDEERQFLKKLGYEYYVLKDRHNAIGNNLVVNDKGGIVSPNINRKEVKYMEDILDVELVPMKILGYSAVGGLCVATNKGFIVHNDVDDETIKQLKTIFSVNGINTTVNMGNTFVSLGAVANDNCCLLGSDTSGFEAQRVSEGLDLI
ncbi:translation initiation factor IF-6 [Candidatus Micrarchaeota archaeon]|nr:translation initiation factor IF-6 [Candidatus Micrarchaeota archaeon]